MSPKYLAALGKIRHYVCHLRAKEVEKYKLCPVCCCIALKKAQVCPVCASYRWIENPIAIESMFLFMARSPIPIDAPVVPRISGIVEEPEQEAPAIVVEEQKGEEVAS
jgi:hypothetical protein